MEFYKDQIKPDTGIELVHISLDADTKSAAIWAKKAKMPWPTILFEDHDRSALTEAYFDDDPEAPSYILVNATGKLITKEKAHAFAKISTLK